MWPYTDSEAKWLSSDSSEPDVISPETLHRYVREAELMRSQMIAEQISALLMLIGRSARSVAKAVKRIFRGSADAHPPARTISQ
jgi:hypothetical protein